MLHWLSVEKADFNPFLRKNYSNKSKAYTERCHLEMPGDKHEPELHATDAQMGIRLAGRNRDGN